MLDQPPDSGAGPYKPRASPSSWPTCATSPSSDMAGSMSDHQHNSLTPAPHSPGAQNWVLDLTFIRLVWRSCRGFPAGSFRFNRGRYRFRFQPPPVKPCMRFSRTRLTDVLHRRHSTFQARKGLGGTTIPSRLIRPRWFGDSTPGSSPIPKLGGVCPVWTATARAGSGHSCGSGRASVRSCRSGNTPPSRAGTS